MGILERGEDADLARSGDVDEAVDVDVDEGGHEELAVKPCQRTVWMTQIGVSKTCP